MLYELVWFKHTELLMWLLKAVIIPMFVVTAVDRDSTEHSVK